MKIWSLKLENKQQTIYTHDINADTPREAFRNYLNMYPGERGKALKLTDWIEVE